MQSIERSIERMSTASRRKRQFPQTVGGPRRDQTVAPFSELSLIHARSHSSEIIQKCLNRRMKHVNALTCWSCEAAVTNAFGERGASKSQNTMAVWLKYFRKNTGSDVLLYFWSFVSKWLVFIQQKSRPNLFIEQRFTKVNQFNSDLKENLCVFKC